MTEIKIYNEQRLYQQAIKKVAKAKISAHNKKIIEKFDRHLKTRAGVSLLRRVKYIVKLVIFAEMLGKDFDKATEDDIEKYVEKIDDRTDIKASTKRDYKVLVKRFYKYLLGNDEEYPKIVKWIYGGNNNEITVKPSELLTQEEIKKVIDSAPNLLEKAFIHSLFESGCRIGEIGTMKREDVLFDQYGVKMRVDGKTGKRTVRLIRSAGDLTMWYRQHPIKEPDAPLWCYIRNVTIRDNEGEPKKDGNGKIIRIRKVFNMQYGNFRRILKESFLRAGINKPYNPHNARHQRVTFMSKYLSDQSMKLLFGWKKNSRVLECYSHMTGEDVDTEVLEAHGIDTKNKEKINEGTIVCSNPDCKRHNLESTRFCYNCGQILNEKLAQELEVEKKRREEGDDLVNQIKGNPEAEELIKKLAVVLSKK